MRDKGGTKLRAECERCLDDVALCFLIPCRMIEVELEPNEVASEMWRIPGVLKFSEMGRFRGAEEEPDITVLNAPRASDLVFERSDCHRRWIGIRHITHRQDATSACRCRFRRHCPLLLIPWLPEVHMAVDEARKEEIFHAQIVQTNPSKHLSGALLSTGFNALFVRDNEKPIHVVRAMHEHGVLKNPARVRTGFCLWLLSVGQITF